MCVPQQRLGLKPARGLVFSLSPLTFEDPPGYTLPAPPLAKSSCNHWYNLYIIKRLYMFALRKNILFGISV